MVRICKQVSDTLGGRHLPRRIERTEHQALIEVRGYQDLLVVAARLAVVSVLEQGAGHHVKGIGAGRLDALNLLLEACVPDSLVERRPLRSLVGIVEGLVIGVIGILTVAGSAEMPAVILRDAAGGLVVGRDCGIEGPGALPAYVVVGIHACVEGLGYPYGAEFVGVVKHRIIAHFLAVRTLVCVGDDLLVGVGGGIAVPAGGAPVLRARVGVTRIVGQVDEWDFVTVEVLQPGIASGRFRAGGEALHFAFEVDVFAGLGVPDRNYRLVVIAGAGFEAGEIYRVCAGFGGDVVGVSRAREGVFGRTINHPHFSGSIGGERQVVVFGRKGCGGHGHLGGSARYKDGVGGVEDFLDRNGDYVLILAAADSAVVAGEFQLLARKGVEAQGVQRIEDRSRHLGGVFHLYVIIVAAEAERSREGDEFRLGVGVAVELSGDVVRDGIADAIPRRLDAHRGILQLLDAVVNI